MKSKPFVLGIATTITLTFCSNAIAQQATQKELKKSNASVVEVKLAAEIEWKKLNPARGDASPQAGTIWGDQTKDGESGFLVKFVDGFSSPPHIHNITYRGIVLSGALHNDDPDATPMWMKTGSYWTQPAGEVHITSARGASIGYVEIQSGPYLVKPPSEAMDNGERPLNVDASNIVWLNVSDTTWSKGETTPDRTGEPQIAFLWGSPDGSDINGTLLKLPAGFSGVLRSESSTFKIVVIKGRLELQPRDGEADKTLTPGGYIGSKGAASHQVSCDDECVIYIRTKGKCVLDSNQLPD